MLTPERRVASTTPAGQAPTVTAVVCTRDRPERLREAIVSVLAQSRPPAEIVLVDDGVEIPALPPDDPPVPIRALRTGGRGPGAARAAGLEAARGELVAWCDDDDVWFPEHLAELVAALEAEPDAALVYGDAEWWQDEDRGQVAYSIDYDGRLLRADNYIFPSSALCRTEAARTAGGFDPALEALEDWDLWLRLGLRHRIRHVHRTLGAMRWSDDGVGARERWGEWQRVHDRTRARLRAAGAAAEHDLVPAAPRARFDSGTWRPGRRELLWHSILGVDHSFGVVSRQLIGALGRQGVDVRIAPTRNQPVLELRHLYRPDDGRGRIGFYYDILRRPSVLPAALTVNYSVWESTVLPEGEVEEINRAVALQYVPSRRNRETYQAAGVEVPVEVLPHGIDAARFPLLDRPECEVLTFGTFGDFSPRKGIDVLLSAFQEEFAAEDPVRLILKSNHDGHGLAADDPRIVWMSGHLPLNRLQALLCDMDVFVLPSRGEAWGMTGLEAMATGLPLIATNWDGPADYLDPSDSLPLSYRLVDCAGVYSNSTVYHGQWAEPDRGQLRRLMRWCLENRERLPAMGTAAAARVRRDFSWDAAASVVRADLDRLAGS